MKNLKFSMLAVLTLSVLLTGCSKDDEILAPVAGDLQYVGQWSGTTSQKGPIKLTVRNIEGNAVVSSISLEMYVSGFGWSATENKLTQGSAIVKNGKFEFTASGLVIHGKFSSNRNLSGEFTNTSAGPPGYSYGTASGTFNAQK